MTEPVLVEVVATVNLWELRAGNRATVNALDPYIARLLAARLLVLVEEEEPDA